MAEEAPPLVTNDQLAKDLSDMADGLSEIQDNLAQKLQAVLKQGGGALEKFYKDEFHLNFRLLENIRFSQVAFLKKIGVTSHEELEEYIKARYGDSKLRSAHEDWLEVEEGWESFLKNSVDKNLNKHYSDDLPTSIDPGAIHVFDCDTDKKVTLKDYMQTPTTIFILLRFFG